MAGMAAVDFGTMHFGSVELGDKRRTNRLVDLVNQIVGHPEGTLPKKLSDPAAYLGMFRLCRREEVTHAAVLEGHRQLTFESMRLHPGVVLLLHDTTELDYTSRRSLHAQLGQIGNGGGRGYECHNSLAVAADTGKVLGLANQILHLRPKVSKDESVAAAREREDRESRLWVLGSAAVPVAPLDCLWVDICDRGGDTFEFIDHEVSTNRRFVVRAKHNRMIQTGHGKKGARHLLFDYARTLPALGARLIEVPARGGQPARMARCLVSAAPIQARPPRNQRGIHGNDPLCLWVVRTWEIDAPAHVTEPLEWILLTNVSAEEFPEAIERLDWYSRRWIIEEFHKGMKTGCGVEGLQFRSIDRLEPMIGILSVVATMIVNLRSAARQAETADMPAAEFVPEVYVAVLSVRRYRTRRTDLTAREFTMALGRLGGHMNRKADGLPGWITLWRGWTKLQQMVDYAIAAGHERSD